MLSVISCFSMQGAMPNRNRIRFWRRNWVGDACRWTPTNVLLSHRFCRNSKLYKADPAELQRPRLEQCHDVDNKAGDMAGCSSIGSDIMSARLEDLQRCFLFSCFDPPHLRCCQETFGFGCIVNQYFHSCTQVLELYGPLM